MLYIIYMHVILAPTDPFILSIYVRPPSDVSLDSIPSWSDGYLPTLWKRGKTDGLQMVSTKNLDMKHIHMIHMML